MKNQDARAAAEMAFDQRREQEISEALRLEQERHDVAIKNMQRLRELRLSKEKRKGC